MGNCVSARVLASLICAVFSGESKVPSGYSAVLSKVTKCEGPISIVMSKFSCVVVLYVYVFMGFENNSSVCGVMIAWSCPVGLFAVVFR